MTDLTEFMSQFELVMDLMHFLDSKLLNWMQQSAIDLVMEFPTLVVELPSFIKHLFVHFQSPPMGFKFICFQLSS